jgi:hypothetical protein
MSVSRQSVHGWVGRYLAEGFARFGRSVASAEELPTPGGHCGEVAVAEMRRKHPRWVRSDSDGLAAQAGGRPDRAVDGDDQPELS